MAFGESKDWWLLLEYSEWLDAEKRLLTPTEEDRQTHSELVDEFIEQSREYNREVV